MTSSPLLEGLPPIADRNAHALVLGNMPSVMSLSAGQYYGNPRNAFWRIAADLFGFAADDPYTERIAAMLRQGIAIWDVLKHCRRIGSLDSAVEPDSMVANDFDTFFATHPGIRRVYFNGAAAQHNYTRLVQVDAHVDYIRLPSTSPAQTMAYADKLSAWRVIAGS